MKQFTRDIWVLVLCLGLVACGGQPQANQYAAECYQRGRELRAADQPVAAMQCFVDATHSGTDDYRLLGRVYSNMANMCRQAERHEKAYAIYEQSTVCFRRAEDTLAVAYGLNNMAWEKAVMGDHLTALQLVDSAVLVCPKPAVQSKVEESLAATYLYAGQYDSALWHAHRIADSLYSHMLLAQAFALSGQCDSALVYAEAVLDRTSNPRYLDDLYYILSHCDSSAAAADIVALTDKRTDVQRELERYKSEMAQAVLLVHEPARAHTSLWLSLVGVALATGVIVWLVRYMYRRNRRRQEVERAAVSLRQSERLKQELKRDNYPEFVRFVDAELWGVATKLRSCGLSERDVRIAVLVLMGFSYAEIADLLNRAESGIGKDKHVIARKLGVSIKNLREALLTIACRK